MGGHNKRPEGIRNKSGPPSPYPSVITFVVFADVFATF